MNANTNAECGVRSAELPSNVVELGNKIADAGEETKAMNELERARQITLRAFDITAKQLEKDALRFEEQAIVGEVPIQRRHELMDHARALRVSCGWLQMLTTPEQAEPAPINRNGNNAS